MGTDRLLLCLLGMVGTHLFLAYKACWDTLTSPLLIRLVVSTLTTFLLIRLSEDTMTTLAD